MGELAGLSWGLSQSP